MTDDRRSAADDASQARTALLQSIADVARAIFIARAASIAMLDEDAHEFVFEAVSGEGAGTLAGARFAADQGFAAIVAQTGEPIVVDDLAGDPRLARSVGERSGYVPEAMMVAPLLHEEDTLGVLWILDRGRTGRSSLQELDLLGAFARQAAMGLALGNVVRRLTAGPDAAAPVDVDRLARRIDALDGERRAAAATLVGALDALLR